jgi:hypothetical protein
VKRAGVGLTPSETEEEGAMPGKRTAAGLILSLLVVTTAGAGGPGSGPRHPFRFSLDAGSDKELSDPRADGDEGFDPGDIYDAGSAAVTPPLRKGGRDGAMDDWSLVGADPYPIAPDYASPPATAIPVGSACTSGRPSCHADYFDADGYDVINVDLEDLGLDPEYALTAPIGEAAFVHDVWKNCIDSPVHLAVSFDDDAARSWADTTAGRVPVESLSPGGYTRGSDTARDEVVALDLSSCASGCRYRVDGMKGIAAESDLHDDLAPNPGRSTEDDDIDALDFAFAGQTCDVYLFSPDHEAHDGLDPGTIYTLGRQELIQGPIHLGLDPDADIDAFEMAWIGSAGGGRALGVVFSVDDDDPRTTSVDESGGLDPGVLYASLMTGTYFELADPFEADETMYGVTYGCDLLEIDPATGAATDLGDLGMFGCQGLASDSLGRILMVTGVSDLYDVDPAGPSATRIASLDGAPWGYTPRALAVGPGGTVYVLLSDSISNDLLYTAAFAASKWVPVGTDGDLGSSVLQGLAFDASGDLYGVGVKGDLYAIDRTTPSATSIGTTGGDYDGQALEFDAAGVLYRTRELLWEVDPATGKSTTIGDTGETDIRGLVVPKRVVEDIDAIAVSNEDLSPGP